MSVDAWLRVSRGLPPADAYTPGDGFVVCVDGARMLPANVTLTKVTVRRAGGGWAGGCAGATRTGHGGQPL